MRVMVVGGGAREHTLAWKIAQSPKVEQIFVAPGNAGTSAIAKNLNIPPTDISNLARAAQENKIDLVVVGPEAPLALGIVDALQKVGIPAFGPTKEATLIESSKAFAKELMQKYGIPCAQSITFSSFAEASNYVKERPAPLVVKADGLAAGKGSIVATTKEQALEAVTEIMKKRVFGSAGDKVVIEECLSGREASFFAFTDGKTAVPMVPACDYKRVFDGDQGPNTGGMGSYSPPEFFTPELTDEVMNTIINPAIKAMAEEGRQYKGVLYAGLMVTSEGPKVLEFNARFGDPESQVTLPLLKTDLVEIIEAVINESLGQIKIEWSNEACVGVVMASGGYPGSYKTGFPISGLEQVDPEILIFQAGTKLEEGRTVTAGGRVLTVVATGKTLAEARDKVYLNLPRIHFEGCHYRKDIAAINLTKEGSLKG